MDNEQDLFPGEIPGEPAAQSADGKTPPGKKKKGRRIVLTILGVFLLIVAILISVGLYYLHLWRTGQWQPSDELRQMIKGYVDSSEIMEQARALKADLKDLAGCIQKQDVSGAEDARERMQADMKKLRSTIKSPLYQAAELAPGVGDDLAAAEELLAILEDADRDLIGPYLELMASGSLSDMNRGDGVRVDVLLSYLDFLEDCLPKAGPLIERMHALDLSRLDSDGKLNAYIDQLAGLVGSGEGMQDLIPAVRAVLGGGEDRLYLFAAQNSSEIRASGGFPGSMGTIRIKDGLLTISDFKSVYKVLQQTTPARANVSTVEDLIFSGRLHLAWDSDFSPDFERVALIWAVSYEDRNHEKLDGVISGTPAIIQRMLSFLGSVTLSDGTELNGENASRVLGHDLYFRYLGSSQQYGATDYVDELFAEAAKETMNLLFSQMNAKMFADFFLFFQESIADRTLMLWMADEDEQELIRQAGWNAGLNTDPAHPQIGVFYNSSAASKVCWFLNIEPELSDPIRNDDGSTSYDLTVRFVNVMTAEERATAGGYILGGTGGITGSMYIFAPAGGSISDAVTTSGYRMLTQTYEGLDLAYLLDLTIPCEDEIVVTCRITTAPGAETPPELIVTPTMQEYR
ncbi:MAG: DUF4012 domain-containing protein [Oscillospiraceae bacterium]|nr:DUF4012 domain-containing protein [Oscillospiraceae bacterium]